MTNWTDSQIRAITALKGDVLVSASAGSGKTSVMIERLSRLVIEEKVDVSRILCLTFTRSAAEEMRGKLKARLIKLAQEVKGSDRARVIDNLDDLCFADVTTIDSFCSKITKKYFENADGGVNPTLIDEGEMKAIKYATAVKVLNDFGETDDKVYFDLLGFLGKKRGEDSFVELILALDAYLSSIPDARQYLTDTIDGYISDVKENFIAKFALKKLLEEAREIEAMALKYSYWKLPYPDEVREKFKEITDKREGGFGEVAKQLDAEYPQKPLYNRRPYTGKKESKEELLHLFSTVDAFREKWAFSGATTFSEDVEESRTYVKKLAEIMLAFIKEYDSRLKRDNLTDFSTIAHEALRLLQIPEIRQEISQNYTHVLIDEYQDTNRLQEEILCASGGGESTFVVGDEKQSIYAFRHAEPDIFRERMQRDGVQVLPLSDNFRQDGHIIDVVNGVFSAVMTDGWSGIDYKKEPMIAGLGYSKGDIPVEMYVMDNSRESSEKVDLPEVYSVKEDKETKAEKISREAIYVESTIKKIVGKRTIKVGDVERPIRYGDIVVISRSRSDGVRKIVDRLRQAGIPVGVSESAGLPTSAEIIINYLRLINNPTLDDALVITMLSPLYSFSEEELARLKLNVTDGESLWSGFISQRGLSTKLDQFFVQTERYIEQAKYLNVHDLVERIIEEREYLLSLANKNGEEECKTLLSYVDSLGGDSTTRSVAEYLVYFDAYPDFSTDFTTGGGDVVRFMTMHGSKGLEFPVVFLVETGKTFFKKDAKESINYHKNLGIGIQTFKVGERIKRENFIYKVISDRKKEEQALEEMRLLYVAMTRAKNLLYISGALSKEAMANKNERLAKSQLGFIQVALNKNPNLLSKINYVANPEEEDLGVLQEESIDIDLSFSYPHEYATKTPAKYTVTGLLDYNLDEEDKMIEIDEDGDIAFQPAESETAKMGTLYHKVMEHIPFDLNSVEEVRQAFSKLVLDEIVDESEIKKVDENIIFKVLSLPVMRRASTSRCRKEQVFLLHATHSELVSGGIDEEVILQGVIDLLVMGEVPIVVDYKFSNKKAENLKATYEKQLKLYEKAVKDILNVDKVEVYLISLKNAECITI